MPIQKTKMIKNVFVAKGKLEEKKAYYARKYNATTAIITIHNFETAKDKVVGDNYDFAFLMEVA
jgi:hypothetical protein